MSFRRLIPAVFFLLFINLPIAAGAAAPIPRLQGPPLGERWFGISMNGERVGFAHTDVVATPDGYELSSEGSVKLKVMAVSRESSSRERYQVTKDLSLRSFQVEQVIDGKPMTLKGVVEGKLVKVAVESGGKTEKKTLKVKKKLLPPPALNFYPPIQGAVAGKTYAVQMLDVEGVKIKGVEIRVIGRESLPEGGEALHLQNDLYPFVDNDIWVDLAGNTLKESVRDGMILTVAEEPRAVQYFIADAALARRDLILDFSLIRSPQPLPDPQKLQGLTAVFGGIPTTFPLYSDERQEASRQANGTVRFRVTGKLPEGNTPQLDQPALAPFLAATATLPADNKELSAKAREIAGEEKDRLKVVGKLVDFVASQVKGSAMESLPPLETLQKKEGNSQSHARLYVTMARSAGIPSRFVAGLVYIKDRGFVYHSWGESYVGRWLAVDPTMGQLPVDASHIKLVEGDGPDELALLGALVGKVKAVALEEQY